MLIVGILLSFAGFWLLRLLVVIPGMLTLNLLNINRETSNFTFPIFISLIFRIAIITSWCFLVFTVLFQINPASSIPNFLFSYFVITAPLNLLATTEIVFIHNGASYETLLFDFILAASIFFGLLIEIDILILVSLTGTLVLAVRILQIIVDLLERKGQVDKL